MRSTLNHLASRFDYVVIDSPPTLPVTDAVVLSSLVDGAIVVVGSGIVQRDQLAHTLESLESVAGRVLGLVLNRVPAEARPAPTAPTPTRRPRTRRPGASASGSSRSEPVRRPARRVGSAGAGVGRATQRPHDRHQRVVDLGRHPREHGSAAPRSGR